MQTTNVWVSVVVGVCLVCGWWPTWAAGTWAVCSRLPPALPGCITRGPEVARCDAGGGEPICEAAALSRHALFGAVCTVCDGPCDVWHKPDVAPNFTREDFEAQEWAQIQGDLERVKLLHAGHAHAQIEAYAALVEGNMEGYREAMRDVRDPSPDAVLRRGQLMGEPSVFGVKRRTKARRWARAIDAYASPSTEIVERTARAIFEQYESFAVGSGLEAKRRGWLTAPPCVRDGYREMGEAAFLAIVREAETALARADNQFSHCPWCGLNDCVVECSRCGGTGPEYVGDMIPFSEPTALGRSLAVGLLRERADRWETGSEEGDENVGWDAVRSELRFVATLIAGDPRAWIGIEEESPPRGWAWVQETSIRSFACFECPWWGDLVIPRGGFVAHNGVTVLPGEMVEDLGGTRYGTNIQFAKVGGIWQVTEPAPYCESAHFDDSRADPFECDGRPGHVGPHHSTWGNGDGSVFTTKWTDAESDAHGPDFSREQPYRGYDVPQNAPSHGLWTLEEEGAAALLYARGWHVYPPEGVCAALGPGRARCVFAAGHVGDHQGVRRLESGNTTLEIWTGEDEVEPWTIEESTPIQGKTGANAMDRNRCNEVYNTERCELAKGHTDEYHHGPTHMWKFLMMCPHCAEPIATRAERCGAPVLGAASNRCNLPKGHEGTHRNRVLGNHWTDVDTGISSSGKGPTTTEHEVSDTVAPTMQNASFGETLVGIAPLAPAPARFQDDGIAKDSNWLSTATVQVQGAVSSGASRSPTGLRGSSARNALYNATSQEGLKDEKPERRQNGGAEVVPELQTNAPRKAWTLASFVQWVEQVCPKITVLYTPHLHLTLEVCSLLLSEAPEDPEERQDPAFSTEHACSMLGDIVKRAAIAINQAYEHDAANNVRANLYRAARAHATDAARVIAHGLASVLGGTDHESCLEEYMKAAANSLAFAVGFKLASDAGACNTDLLVEVVRQEQTRLIDAAREVLQ